MRLKSRGKRKLILMKFSNYTKLLLLCFIHRLPPISCLSSIWNQHFWITLSWRECFDSVLSYFGGEVDIHIFYHLHNSINSTGRPFPLAPSSSFVLPENHLTANRLIKPFSSLGRKRPDPSISIYLPGKAAIMYTKFLYINICFAC